MKWGFSNWSRPNATPTPSDVEMQRAWDNGNALFYRTDAMSLMSLNPSDLYRDMVNKRTEVLKLRSGGSIITNPPAKKHHFLMQTGMRLSMGQLINAVSAAAVNYRIEDSVVIDLIEKLCTVATTQSFSRFYLSADGSAFHFHGGLAMDGQRFLYTLAITRDSKESARMWERYRVDAEQIGLGA